MGEPGRDRLTLTVVGSGTAVPEPDRVCSGYLLDTGALRLLLDCGPGIVHNLARFALPWQHITHIALTHFHNDHTGDLPTLFFALRYGMLPPRSAPLTIIAPPGIEARLEHLAHGFGDHVRDPGFPLIFRHPTPGHGVALADDVRLTAHATGHTPEALAFRIATPSGDVGYTGDTPEDDRTAAFLAGVELLLMECSLPESHAMDSHLTPERAARMANRSSPGKLLLTHVYPLLDRRALPARLREAGWLGTTLVVQDGLRVVLPADASPPQTPNAGPYSASD